MSRWDTRSATTTRTIGSLVRSVGLAAGRKARLGLEPARELIEVLEDRKLLASDEPNFNQVFGTNNPQNAPVITLDGFGVGTSATGNGQSTISPALDSDVFRFTAPADDFVRIWADTLSTGSTLDSRVEVYTGTPGPGTPTLVASGSNNGTLTSGVFKDGWVGFKATAGTEYFVVVRSDLANGSGSIGDYTLRVNAKSTAFSPLDPGSGLGSAAGNVTRRGGDVVYKVVTGSAAGFDGLMTITATADSTVLDPRLDIYRADGTLITFDDDSGSQTDAYAAIRSGKSQTFYVRVRSDKIAALTPSTGAFTLNIDGIARAIALDPVTRLGQSGVLGLADQTASELFRFQSRGTGLSFVTINVGFMGGLPDSAVRIYNDAGTQIGFNELQSAYSRLEIQLVGGQNYYVVVENFDGTAGGVFRVEVEAHHTYDQNQPIDDHVSTPAANLPFLDRLHQFELATPVIWGSPQNAPVPVDGIGLPDPSADHVQVELGQVVGRIHNAGDTDLFQFVPPTDMLGDFPGINDNRIPPPPMGTPAWTPRFRPASRLQILSNGETLENTRIRVFDSNLDLVYDTNNQVLSAFTDPSGMLDPASFPPQLPTVIYGFTFAQGQPAGIKVWGGEVYYMEVSSQGGSGRYDVTLQVDAPVDSNATIPAPTGVLSKFGPILPSAGGFANAYEVQIDPNTGDGRPYNGVAAFGNPVEDPPGSGAYTAGSTNGTPVLLGRSYAANLPANVPQSNTPPIPAGTGAGYPAPFHVAPGTKGRGILEMSDLGNINSPTATQLYQFRALYTGTAEVRLSTTAITDEFWEGITTTETNDPSAPPPPPPPVLSHTSATKTYNSPLDGALRIFNNDQQEIQYNNDNEVTAGEFDTRNVGSFAGRVFKRSDPRTVFPVEAGKIYYIQVESGQRNNFTLAFPKVDWRHATGSYELLINSMPNLNFGDDHINGTADVQATPIPQDLNNHSTTATLGSVSGEILNTLANPLDTDLFTFFAASRGTATITVATLQNDPTGFDRDVKVFDTNGAPVTSTTVIGTDSAVLSFLVNQGERFYVQVSGAAGDPQQQGQYTIALSGLPSSNNHSQEPNYFGAIDIPKDLYDYDKTETVDGTLPNPGDTQIYQFQTIAYDVAKITVHSLNASLRPSVRIYELGLDGAGNPVLLPIAFNTAATAGGDAVISFSVTAPNRTSNGNTLNNYYAVVSGADRDLDFGDFQITIDVNVATDDHPDAGQWTVADAIPLSPTGQGSSSGSIELAGDTDLFTYTSPSQGLTIIQVTSPASSLLNVRVRIFDENHQPVLDEISGNPDVTGPDQQVSVAEFRFTAQRNKQYFIQVEGVTPFGTTFKTANTGAYLVGIAAPIPDDYPNINEFDIAQDIPISIFSGGGSAAGTLEVATDTDLFKFTAIVNGTMTIRLDALGGGSGFKPVLRLFANDLSHTEIGSGVVDGGPGDEDGQVNGSVQRTIPMSAGQTYFVLVGSDQQGSVFTGGYTLELQGTQPPPGPDDFANAGDYVNAHQIDLSTLTAQGSQSGMIEQAADTDLFYIRPPVGSVLDPRKVYVQVVTPNGEALDVAVRIIRIINGVPQVITSDSAGGPGTNAQTDFDATAAGAQYFIEVDGQGGTGSYTVRVAAAPQTYFLYFPEGYANANIREYISIGNSNTFDVHYTVRLRYENGDPETVITGMVLANHRGGLTVSDGTANPGSGVQFNKPYAIVIESDGFIGANISHYDFGNTLGEAFTGRTSTMWSFAQAEKFPGQASDFILYYNPNPTPVIVTLTAYQTDPNTGTVTTVAMSQIVQGFRRFGWNVNQTAQLPVGKFSFTLTSANAPGVPVGTPHIGIVAELSHNDLANHFGYAVLGDPDGGATSGVIPGVVNTAGAAPIVTFFNPSNTAANVGIIGKYIDVGQPDFVKNVTLQPGESRTFDATSLGLVPNQVVGLRWDSDVPITTVGGSKRNGSSDITQGATQAATSWYYGDAFINRHAAGTLYFEDMFFYNPDTADLPVTLTFFFNNSNVPTTYDFVIPAKGFSTVALHTLPAILNHAVFNYFAINATAARPFVSLMSHYDLVLNGGWGTKGAALGLTNPISSIT